MRDFWENQKRSLQKQEKDLKEQLKKHLSYYDKLLDELSALREQQQSCGMVVRRIKSAKVCALREYRDTLGELDYADHEIQETGRKLEVVESVIQDMNFKLKLQQTELERVESELASMGKLFEFRRH